MEKKMFVLICKSGNVGYRDRYELFAEARAAAIKKGISQNKDLGPGDPISIYSVFHEDEDGELGAELFSSLKNENEGWERADMEEQAMTEKKGAEEAQNE